jgi:hypothetical protein
LPCVSTSRPIVRISDRMAGRMPASVRMRLTRALPLANFVPVECSVSSSVSSCRVSITYRFELTRVSTRVSVSSAMTPLVLSKNTRPLTPPKSIRMGRPAGYIRSSIAMLGQKCAAPMGRGAVSEIAPPCISSINCLTHPTIPF